MTKISVEVKKEHWDKARSQGSVFPCVVEHAIKDIFPEDSVMCGYCHVGIGRRSYYLDQKGKDIVLAYENGHEPITGIIELESVNDHTI